MSFFKKKLLPASTFLLGIFATSLLPAEISMSKNMNDLEYHLENACENTLIVFDIDNTLIVPETAAFQIPNVKPRKKLLKHIVPSWTENELGIAISLMGLEGMGILLDKSTPELIQRLQKKGVRCIALTALNTGLYEGYKDIFAHRANQLKKHGIDFSDSAPHTEYTVFNQLTKEVGCYPAARDGIVMSNGEKNEKGHVLLAYLDRANWSPEFVVFVDDKKSHVENMSSILNEKGIKNTCVHFEKIKDFEPSPINEEEFVKTWELLGEKAKATLKARDAIN
ncbi:MAG: hypothetical protein S4CHLAM37_04160 [Chlamydiia bacterium]|nr:hypothetical protein [Chlamydiia bacterium]